MRSSSVVPNGEDPTIAAEVDRMMPIYMRINITMRKRRAGYLEVGAALVEEGVVAAEDWAVLRELDPSVSTSDQV